jgi:hypothetical protein
MNGPISRADGLAGAGGTHIMVTAVPHRFHQLDNEEGL